MKANLIKRELDLISLALDTHLQEIENMLESKEETLEGEALRLEIKDCENLAQKIYKLKEENYAKN